MSTIQIVADSTCDIEPSLLQHEHLEVLPLIITIGEQNYLDGENITVSEVYEFMRRGIIPRTAQITYEKTYLLFKTLLEGGKDILYISFSSVMSGSYALAHMVAEDLISDYPERKIAVIDSKGGSGATGIIVTQALKMVASGCTFETAEAQVRFMADHIEHVFAVDDLEWLAKGGRVPKLVGYIGSKLGFHPVLDVEEGRMVVKKIVRGSKNAVQAVASEIIARAQQFPSQVIAICHADDLASAKSLERLIKEGLPNCVTSLCHIGGVLGVHIGLKGIAAFCLNQKPEQYSPA